MQKPIHMLWSFDSIGGNGLENGTAGTENMLKAIFRCGKNKRSKKLIIFCVIATKKSKINTKK